MSLASTRDKRGNAGNRMQRMLDEEEDDFYKTTYGGFAEESGDDEFSSGEEEKAGEETSSDSDISASEDDEVISEEEDDGPKRAKRVVTKAYKEPVKQKEVKKMVPPCSRPRNSHQRPPRQRPATRGTGSQVRKSSRRSTVQRVNEFQRRIKEREEKSRHTRAGRKALPGMRRMTQEELLREARITEKQNLASLKVYQQMEAEKKKVKIPKRVHHGPKIRFHSLTMPLIVELPSPTKDNIVNVDSSGTTEEKPVSKKRCSRNFITISEDKLYSQFFPRKSGRPPAKLYCPVTRMPAKYIDPITSIPYATKKAFKIIRETYATEIENAMMDRRKKQKKSAKS